MEKNSRITILGHRGFKAKYPENTLLSFTEAIKHGADGIELDVWLTGDGELVILHDEDFARVGGVSKKIKDMSLEEVKKIDLGMGQSPPTLAEIFDTLSNGIINVEIKDPEAVEKTLELIERHGNEDRVMISSFNIDALRKVRELNSHIRVGLLVEDEKIIPKIPQLAKELNLYSVNLPIDAIEMFPLDALRGTMAQIRGLGLKIALWADKDELFYKDNNILKLQDLVDIVITDDIVRMRELLSKKF